MSKQKWIWDAYSAGPSAEVTPEGLGRKGWDGNVALEWLTKQLAGQRKEETKPERAHYFP